MAMADESCTDVGWKRCITGMIGKAWRAPSTEHASRIRQKVALRAELLVCYVQLQTRQSSWNDKGLKINNSQETL